jgi:predicted porin
MTMILPAWADDAQFKTGGSYEALFGAGGRPVGSTAGNPTAPGRVHSSGFVGARLSGRPDSASSFDQYLFIQGNVGEVNLGPGRGPAYSMQFTAPYSGAVPGGAALSAIPRAKDAGRSASYVLLAGQAYRLGYFTPRFVGGMTGGLSLGPSPSATAPAQAMTAPPGRLDEAYENFEIGGSYVARFDTMELALSAGHEGARSERGLTPDASAWNVGIGLSYAGFKIGGAYYKAEDMMLDMPSLPRMREQGYSLGLGYGGSDWWVGTGVSRLTQKLDNAGATGTGTTAYRLGGEYRLSPGMMIFSDVMLYNTDAGGSGPRAPAIDDNRAFLLGIDLSF